MKSLGEFDDVKYGPNGYRGTIVDIARDDDGAVARYVIELHEGYADPVDHVVYARPEDVRSA